MSIENAVLTHAEALTKLAEAITAAFGPQMLTRIMDTRAGSFADDLLEDKAAELASATKERAAAAKQAQERDAELETAVTKVEDDAQAKAMASAEAKRKPAKKEEANETKTQVIDKAAMQEALEAAKKEAAELADGLDTPLDYKTDVRPKLLEAIKKAGKDKVQELINTFGVDKADKVDPAQYGELLAGATKLAA